MRFTGRGTTYFGHILGRAATYFRTDKKITPSLISRIREGVERKYFSIIFEKEGLAIQFHPR